MDSSLIISIVGIPAVGKTTTVDLLPNSANNYVVIKEKYPNSITDILHKTLKAKTNSIRHNIQTIFFEHDIKKITKIKKLQENHNLVVIDRGLEDTWLVTDFYAEQGLVNKTFFHDRYYDRISPFFSDIIVYLSADMEVVAKRSQYRDSLNKGPKRSKNNTFVSDLFVKSNYYSNWHHKNSNCIDIDNTYLPPEIVASKVHKIIIEASEEDKVRMQK